MNALISRNLKIYRRDKMGVLFSLLGVLIFFVLYSLFLKNFLITDEMKQVMDPENMMNHWLIAGMLSIGSVTTTLGAFGVMISDKHNHALEDFYISPLKKSRVATGYLGSAYIVGVVMSLIVLLFGEGYILLNGGSLLSPLAFIKVIGILLLSTLINVIMLYLIISFVSTNSAFMSVSTLIGTVIGFLTGVYIPIVSLSDNVQLIVKFFPPAQISTLLRQVMMEDSMNQGFNGIPVETVQKFKETLGVYFIFDGSKVTIPMSLLYLTCVLIVLALLALIRNKFIKKMQ